MAASTGLSSSTAFIKPKLSFWQIFNMSFGFFGIQFGWDLQRANMGPIYEYLKASPDQIPVLFLAAPLTGLIVQPIIGYMSDRTWHPWWGRRRPYFFIGAVLSTICLFLMPNSGALWMAAGLLWLLDTSGNIAMEPFRAFIADKLPDSQRNRGFAMQSFLIGVGGTVANLLPILMSDVFHISKESVNGSIPASVKFSFYTGGSIFFAAVLYTILTSKEYPPPDLAFRDKVKESNKGFGGGVREINECIQKMPKKMKQLA
ncbi:MAG: MFS transporter, partial [Bacteroidetes bacterium]|nr:MFS transporter [Bacteroidota bacterium]